MINIRVTQIYYYPIKSCKGFSVGEREIISTGFKDDRLFMIVDESGKFVTQRSHPQMALIKAEVEQNFITVEIPGEEKFKIDTSGGNNFKKVRVEIWKDHPSGYDMGDDIAEKLSKFLNKKVRLVKKSRQKRVVNPKYAKHAEEVGFADGYPFLLTSESSLKDLNERIGGNLPMGRFRPNIVVSGSSPWDEDRWAKIKIGNVFFDVVKACARCTITTVDQIRGIRDGREPLATLAKFRKAEGGVLFGQNMIHNSNGIIKLGDRVEVLDYKEPEIKTL